MRALPLAVCIALAACGPGRGKVTEFKPGNSLPTDIDLDRVVAWYNGEPLSWKEVAKRMMELNIREAVKKYVWWRCIHDEKRKHGIRSSEGELDRRAGSADETIGAQVRGG